MTNPNFLLPLVRPFLPKWWADRIPLDRAVRLGKELRTGWDDAALYANANTESRFLAELRERVDAVIYTQLTAFDRDGLPIPPDRENADTALLYLAGLCLARLAAVESSDGK